MCSSADEISNYRNVVCVYIVVYVFLKRWEKSFSLLVMS